MDDELKTAEGMVKMMIPMLKKKVRRSLLFELPTV